MSVNTAAWLASPRADLVVGPADMPVPGRGEILLRNRAVAVNPLDELKQWTGDLMYRWLSYPMILGEDVAGVVEAVGPGVTRFSAGDRVAAYAVGMERGRRHDAEGGFQQYTVVREDLAAPLPDDLAFADAVVLPLAVSTAATALFQTENLGLVPPTAAQPGTGVVLVWGGSTSVGMNAIQLAVAAGYRVITTASARNADLLRGLGASDVFDYSSASVERDILAALRGDALAGVAAVGPGSGAPAVRIAAAAGAKRVALLSPPVSFGSLPRRGGPSMAFVRTMSTVAWGQFGVLVRARLRGIRTSFVWGSALMSNEVGPMLWEHHLPAALADGRHVCAPVAEVVGDGLESIQSALDRLHRGVSARKLVVTL
ncbi:zinc-binding alcohol dehydrogenase family protein [Microbacterium sp. cf332]|uniref:zinc-binding alcohol dehydrogenase family protein n=1 Tax=Microbacterium sp. cf332 TaxID=1761804 RepID=UPI00088A9D96|nr:zinc-binding alcohol dehydrogenase family protein [Microbacterium sp. cf332]SDQ08833.1 Alcohol dehydrogenase GroES-like domain-containing protein [Microbacterium sp. cf332]